MLNFILASTVDGGIGLNGGMPWHYAEDMKVFKTLTTGGSVLMGRKTFDSLPAGGLKNRTQYIMSSREVLADADHISCVAQACEFVRKEEARDSDYVMWIIGGAQIYKAFSTDFTYAHLTIIHDEYECDTYYKLPHTRDLLSIYNRPSIKHNGRLQYQLLFNNNGHNQRNLDFEDDCEIKVKSVLNSYRELMAA